MYHISDVKKYTKCPRLYGLDLVSPKREYQPFVRLDEEVTTIACQKLKVGENYFLGHRGDDAKLAMDALQHEEWLIKARFEYAQLRVKVPFLHHTKHGWDLYFLFIGLYPHSDDMQFYCDTVWVLEQLKVKIHNAYIIHLNENYVRGDELNPEELFVITEHFYNNHNNPSEKTILSLIHHNMRDITHTLDEMDLIHDGNDIEPKLSNRCASRQKCRYYDLCFPEINEMADNSILTLIASQYKQEMNEEGLCRLKDADPNRVEGSKQQYAQIMADQLGGLFVDQCALQSWIGHIQYPISFLDFEWERFAIPPYKGMKPYDVLPFEYSLHIMQEDGSIQHTVYLNTEDDREDMAKHLVEDIPSNGTVMAYNAFGAESIRIQELADQFPKYQEQLNSINQRMEDLQLIFATGVVYDVRMRGQWSLKVIMAMMNDKSYKDLDINQGMEAVFQWRHLDHHDEDVDREKIEADLKKYCGMDSYAMTVVYQWLLTLL